MCSMHILRELFFETVSGMFETRNGMDTCTVRFTRPGSVTGRFHELRSGLGLLLKIYAGPGLVS